MARFKNQNRGNKSVPKALKKKLTTKRDSVKSDDLSNQRIRIPQRGGGAGESNGSQNESYEPSAESPPYTARKMISRASRISDSDSEKPHSARKSISNQVVSEPHYVARKSVAGDQSFEQSSSDSDSGAELLKAHPNRSSIRIRKHLSQSTDKEDSSIEKSTSELGQSSQSVSNVETLSSKRAPTVVVRKVRKSGNHMRPFTAPNVSHRRKNGILALQQIRFYQRQTGLLIPKTNFQRLVRQILGEYSNSQSEYRIQRDALLALQESAEFRLTQFFEAGQLCAIHANRVTLMNRDFKLVKYFDH